MRRRTEPAPIGRLRRLRLLYCAPGGIRFLNLIVQGMQIVRGGNHGEQKDQETTQKKDAAETGLAPKILLSKSLLPPDQKSGNYQRQPEKVKK